MRTALALSLLGAAALPAGAVTDAERGDIEGVVHDYLLRNPEVLVEAMNALNAKRAAQEAKEQTAAIATAGPSLFATPEGTVLGNPKGDVTVVEFFDYNCSYCKRALADMEGLLDQDGQVRFILKEIPVLGDDSVAASHVSLAFRHLAPEKYGEFHRKLLALRGVANQESAIAIAEELGVQDAALRAAMASPDVEAAIAENTQLAGLLRVDGTPFYVVGDEVVPGAIGLEGLAAKIENVRRCASASC
jgi:protein-disulfide isomerase